MVSVAQPTRKIGGGDSGACRGAGLLAETFDHLSTPQRKSPENRKILGASYLVEPGGFESKDTKTQLKSAFQRHRHTNTDL